MTDGFEIRAATAADALILGQHRAGMFRDMGVLTDHLYQTLVDATRDYFEQAIPSGEYVAWVAYPTHRSQEIVAGAGVQLRRVLPHPKRPDGNELSLGPQGIVLNVYTEPAWRRRGIALLLMRRVLEWASANDVTNLVLHASQDGRSLYEKLGFVQTNEMRFAPTGETQRQSR